MSVSSEETQKPHMVELEVLESRASSPSTESCRTTSTTVGAAMFGPQISLRSMKSQSSVAPVETPVVIVNPYDSSQMSPTHADTDRLVNHQSVDYPGLNIHGVHDICSPHIRRGFRLLWLVVVILAGVVLCMSCYTVAWEFVTHAKASKIELKHVPQMILPRLTICPQTPDVFNKKPLWDYLHSSFPDDEDETLKDLVAYILGGSGFEGMEARLAQIGNVSNTEEMYRFLRGNLTVDQFFHFFFNRFTTTCRQLFNACNMNGKHVGCCDFFEPYYTIKHGRCFSLIEVPQLRADEQGKMLVKFRNYLSFLSKEPIKPEIIAFVHDRLIDIAPFPRYFIQKDLFNKIRLTTKRIIVINDETPPICGDSPYGKGTCYLKHRLNALLHQPHNCTVPYWPLDDPNRKASCEPKLLVERYNQTIEAEHHITSVMNTTACLVPCDRWEYERIWEVQKGEKPFKNHGYNARVEISYTDLEYEEISEIRTVTFWGFMAQIGGQLGLFLGSSIISIFQLMFAAVLFIQQRAAERFNSYAKTKGPTQGYGTMQKK